MFVVLHFVNCANIMCLFSMEHVTGVGISCVSCAMQSEPVLSDGEYQLGFSTLDTV